MEMTIIRIAFPITIFALLYIMAFISNRHYRNSEDVFYIKKSMESYISVNATDFNSYI